MCASYIDTDISICICLIVCCIFLPVAVPNVLQSKAIAGLQDSPLLSAVSEGTLGASCGALMALLMQLPSNGFYL